MSTRDDDDWVGEPPEGRYSRDRANPGFWTAKPPLAYTLVFFGLFILALVVVILAL